LLHDLDYQSHPDVHPQKALEWLAEKGYEADVIQAVKGHGLEDVASRPTPLAKTLYAVDELASFIIAVALMRPTQLEGMVAKSVVKKMKDKAFAKAVDRDGIKRAAEELGVDLNEHINRIIEGLQTHQAFLLPRGESLL
jgi:predicted hydrolase (HD superfamily)